MDRAGVGSLAAQHARADPHLEYFDIGGFPLESGMLLPSGAKLAYRVHGPSSSSSQSDGVILHPTSFDAVHTDLEYQIGPGKTLDTNKYTVIVPNLLGNGVSFSPSLSSMEDGYPLITIGDNVRLQRKLLREELRLSSPTFKLKLVYGYSMGGLQAYDWAISYPEEVERIAVVCGAANCSELNAIFLSSLEAALTADSSWDVQTQRFRVHPTKGLRAFATIYAGWGVGSSYYEEQSYKDAGYTSADDFLARSYIPAFAHCDANDLLSQIRTWRTTTRADGTLQQALSMVIQAKVLLMPCDTDRYFTLKASKHEADLLGLRQQQEQQQISVVLRPIWSTSGHRAGDPHRPELAAELAYIRKNVHELLSLE